MVVRAHAGGIDEMLLIILPMLMFRLFYRLGRGPRREDPSPTSKPRPKR